MEDWTGEDMRLEGKLKFRNHLSKEESDELRDLKGNAIFVGEFSAQYRDWETA